MEREEKKKQQLMTCLVNQFFGLLNLPSELKWKLTLIKSPGTIALPVTGLVPCSFNQGIIDNNSNKVPSTVQTGVSTGFKVKAQLYILIEMKNWSAKAIEKEENFA